jgi:hypothetical protein
MVDDDARRPTIGLDGGGEILVDREMLWNNWFPVVTVLGKKTSGVFFYCFGVGWSVFGPHGAFFLATPVSLPHNLNRWLLVRHHIAPHNVDTYATIVQFYNLVCITR